MVKFMDKDFLLTTKTAKKLFHDYAEKMPVIDYHCHINPKEIWENHKFRNITEAWLGGDHYKWRAIRTNGVEEEKITGTADDKTKFDEFAKMLEKAIGNPLFPWTHLELQRYFDYHEALNSKTADKVWELCNKKLEGDDFRVRPIIEKSNVKLICSTDDPADSLEYHKLIRDDETFKVQVLPAWRPDKAMNINAPTFKEYLATLSEVAGVEIHDFATLLKALKVRLDFFEEMGCKASDHSLSSTFFEPASVEELNAILQKGINNEEVTELEIKQYHTALLMFLGREYAKKNWVMQLHIGVIRNSNTKMFESLGADAGFDCIAASNDPLPLVKLLDNLAKDDLLPKTILYSLNPCDNTAIDSVIGCFQNSDAKCKVQHGSAWWFNDTELGMRNQIQSLASCSLLGNFVGMLTDSRSFLSYTRHEYFRRILCDEIGKWVEDGSFPQDYELLGKMVEDISYNNCVEYFGFDL